MFDQLHENILNRSTYSGPEQKISKGGALILTNMYAVEFTKCNDGTI